MRKYINTCISPDEFIIVGLDVHKDSISACVLDRQRGEIVWQNAFANERSRLRKFIQRVRSRFGEPRCCYEASSCGFALYRQRKDLGVACDHS